MLTAHKREAYIYGHWLREQAFAFSGISRSSGLQALDMGHGIQGQHIFR